MTLDGVAVAIVQDIDWTKTMTGVLNLVSVGPGFADLIIPRAEAALKSSDVIVAYELYLRWIEPWIEGKEIHTPPLTQERERAMIAIDKARSGAKVALIQVEISVFTRWRRWHLMK